MAKPGAHAAEAPPFQYRALTDVLSDEWLYAWQTTSLDYLLVWTKGMNEMVIKNVKVRIDGRGGIEARFSTYYKRGLKWHSFESIAELVAEMNR